MEECDQCPISDFNGGVPERELIAPLPQTLLSRTGLYDQAALSAGSF